MWCLQAAAKIQNKPPAHQYFFCQNWPFYCKLLCCGRSDARTCYDDCALFISMTQQIQSPTPNYTRASMRVWETTTTNQREAVICMQNYRRRKKGAGARCLKEEDGRSSTWDEMPSAHLCGPGNMRLDKGRSLDPDVGKETVPWWFYSGHKCFSMSSQSLNIQISQKVCSSEANPAPWNIKVG